jgi:ubiquitin-protein ligase
MSYITINRLNKELTRIQKEKIDLIEIDHPDDILIWTARISGPLQTPYEGGIFNIVIKFDMDYPIKPPSLTFLTPMYHPNIYKDGKICIDILQGEWTPTQSVRTILLSILSLLMDPNPMSPANREAASLYLSNKEKYNETVREYVRKTMI